MAATWHRARWVVLLLPLVAIALLLPKQPALAAEKRGAPTREQVKHFKRGLESWKVALEEEDRGDRDPILAEAEEHFGDAASGPGRFPEAILGVGLVRYTRDHILEAEPVFQEIVDTTQGAMRAEALTYLGLINLRTRRWRAAKAAFEESMEEDLSETTTSFRGAMGDEFREALNERLGRLDCVARVGSVLASYYLIQDPRATCPGAEDYMSLLEEIDRLLGGKDAGNCEEAFNDTDAAIARWPAPPVDWNYNLLDPPCDGVRLITLQEFVTALKIWAGAELAFEPQKGVEIPSYSLDQKGGKGEGLSDQDRYNLAAGLLKRALNLEAAGDLAAAFPIWEQLATFPETSMAARQHMIWILLQRPPGENAPARGNLDAAKQLIHGALVEQDPLLFEEALALATSIMYSVTDPAQAAATYEEARVIFREILNGIPGAEKREAPDWVRRIAEWNLAVLAVAMPERTDPAYWEQALADFPPAPGRERIRMFMALRLAEAYLIADQPERVEQALALAEKIAAGEEGKGSLPVPNAEKVLMCFRRYLAEQAVKRNVVEKYRQGFLRRTDYFGEYRAWEAAEMYRKFVADLMANPATVTDAPRIWNAILGILQDARQFTDDNKDLQQRLDRDIAAVQTYLGQLQANPPAITYAWNQAANRTNTAQSPQDWDAAAQAWRGVLGMLQGRPAADRTEAALRIVNAYMKKADVLFKAGDKNGARAALEQAREALSNGPNGVGADVPAADRDETTKRLENNLRALGAGEEMLVPPGPANIAPYKGGPIGPCRARCVIIHYHEQHQPDVTDWLNRLQSNPDAVKRLVDWFNNGPLAQKTPDAKRDFSADPNSPNYLVTFLSKHIHRTPGNLRRGATQWCDHNGVGPWQGYPVRADTAAYYLENGVAIINADCSNPLAPIRVRKAPGEWMTCPERAIVKPFPQFPPIIYSMPMAEFSIYIEGIFQPYALPNPFVAPLPIIPPALSVLSVPETFPKLAPPSYEKGRPSYEKGEEEKGGKSEPLPQYRKPQ